MAFKTMKYESDDGTIHPIRIAKKFESHVGSQPTGNFSSDLNARTRKGVRQYGLRARGWRYYREITAGDDTFRRYLSVPKLTESAWESNSRPDITIGGNTWKFLARYAEDAD